MKSLNCNVWIWPNLQLIASSGSGTLLTFFVRLNETFLSTRFELFLSFAEILGSDFIKLRNFALKLRPLFLATPFDLIASAISLFSSSIASKLNLPVCLQAVLHCCSFKMSASFSFMAFLKCSTCFSSRWALAFSSFNWTSNDSDSLHFLS